MCTYNFCTAFNGKIETFNFYKPKKKLKNNAELLKEFVPSSDFTLNSFGLKNYISSPNKLLLKFKHLRIVLHKLINLNNSRDRFPFFVPHFCNIYICEAKIYIYNNINLESKSSNYRYFVAKTIYQTLFFSLKCFKVLQVCDVVFKYAFCLLKNVYILNFSSFILFESFKFKLKKIQNLQHNWFKDS